MQRTVAFALAACLAAAFLNFNLKTSAKEPANSSSAAPAKPAATAQQAANDLIVGEPVRFKNLAVFPVTSRVPKNDDRYLTLDEGLKSGAIQVFEIGSPAAQVAQAAVAQPAPVNQAPPRQTAPPPAANQSNEAQSGDSPEVNRLMLLNKSEKPLYLMPGEIIYGGRQNRTIAKETIIPPGKKPVEIDVFCVESGRWANRTAEVSAVQLKQLASISEPKPADAKAGEEAAKKVAKLAEEAQQGKFVAGAGALSKEGRVAVQSAKAQGEVWNQVQQANGFIGNASASADFAAAYTDPQIAKQLAAYIDAVQSPVAKRSQVVGAIVAVNGRVEAADVFQSTPLFLKLWPKLLKGDATDALAAADRSANKSSAAKDAGKEATLADAREFLRGAMQAGVAEKTDGSGGLVVTKRDSETLMSFSAASPAASGGGFGGAIHSSGYAKKR